jgi:hypothetical protein
VLLNTAQDVQPGLIRQGDLQDDRLGVVLGHYGQAFGCRGGRQPLEVGPLKAAPEGVQDGWFIVNN